MFTVRENEPEYARLRKESSQKINQYGNSIDTVPADDARCGFSLNILLKTIVIIPNCKSKPIISVKNPGTINSIAPSAFAIFVFTKSSWLIFPDVKSFILRASEYLKILSKDIPTIAENIINIKVKNPPNIEAKYELTITSKNRYKRIYNIVKS